VPSDVKVNERVNLPLGEWSVWVVAAAGAAMVMAVAGAGAGAVATWLNAIDARREKTSNGTVGFTAALI
jgi:hypothetical protein